jgi:hypothetical protein
MLKLYLFFLGYLMGSLHHDPYALNLTMIVWAFGYICLWLGEKATMPSPENKEC